MDGSKPSLEDRPDFLGVGAQKCGTTWLYARLREHPDIWMPRWKEIHFFDWKMQRRHPLGVHLLRPTAQDKRRQLIADILHSVKKKDEIPVRTVLRYHLGRPSLDWYRELFIPGRGKVRGEITPGYATITEEEIRKVASHFPGTRYIFLLRSPIERDWSAAVMGLQQQGIEVDTAPIDHLIDVVDSQAFVVRADMHRGLMSWVNVVGPSQMFVGFLEDIHFNPSGFLRSIHGYLGLQPIPDSGQESQKVHARSGSSLPLESAKFLANRHLEQMTRLSETFGGYAELWRVTAEWIINQPESRGAVLPYPLWELPIWETTARQLGIQKGTYLQSRVLG